MGITVLDHVCLCSETVSQGSKQSWTVERPYSSSRPSSLKEEAVNSRLFERAKAAPLPVEDVEADVKKLAEPFTRGMTKPLKTPLKTPHPTHGLCTDWRAHTSDKEQRLKSLNTLHN